MARSTLRFLITLALLTGALVAPAAAHAATTDEQLARQWVDAARHSDEGAQYRVWAELRRRRGRIAAPTGTLNLQRLTSMEAWAWRTLRPGLVQRLGPRLHLDGTPEAEAAFAGMLYVPPELLDLIGPTEFRFAKGSPATGPLAAYANQPAPQTTQRWAQTAGMHIPGVVSVGNGSPGTTVLHELGHAVDDVLALSQRPDVLAWWSRLRSSGRLDEYTAHAAPFGPSEFVADVVLAFCRGRDWLLQERWGEEFGRWAWQALRVWGLEG